MQKCLWIGLFIVIAIKYAFCLFPKKKTRDYIITFYIYKFLFKDYFITFQMLLFAILTKNY